MPVDLEIAEFPLRDRQAAAQLRSAPIWRCRIASFDVRLMAAADGLGLARVEA